VVEREELFRQRAKRLRRTYGSLELSGISCIVDLHIDSSVIRDAALSAHIPDSSNMG
jgi:hypothetical protein